MLLCLHEWGVEDHPTITSPDVATPGNGLFLVFRVDDFAAAVVSARTAGAPLEEEPHIPPRTRAPWSFALRSGRLLRHDKRCLSDCPERSVA